MATKLTAARQLTLYAADRYDSGERCDMEAGMAKLFASEVAMEIALNAVRIHGGYGYSTRVRRRALLPRRAADDRRRGHQRDSAQRHRRPAGGARRDLMRAAPAYQTLRDQLRDEIAAGRYRDGVRLPTESELVARHGCRGRRCAGVSGSGRRGRGVPGAGPRHLRQRRPADATCVSSAPSKT